MVVVPLTRRSFLQRSLALAGLALLPGALAACLQAPAEPAPDSVADRVDAYINAEMKIRKIPGLALAIVQQGTVVKMQGYGLANVELDVPVKPETVFDLASVTKQFTATAIMLLVEEGRVGLDDPIVDYLPAAPPKWNGISVRHLLTHTAGFPSTATGFAALSLPNGGRTNISTTLMYDAATKDPLSFAPGTAWQYSDVGYFLLGMIVEKASERRYRDFLAERFFQPLGMTATSVLDLWAILKNRAAGYTLRSGELVNIRRVSQVELNSYAGVFSTVGDLVTWDAALDAGRVVKPVSLAQMWTPVTLANGRTHPYGFGWEFKELRGHRVISHGGITGTEYTRFPDDGLTVVVLTNLGRRPGMDPVNSWGLTIGVAGSFIPDLRYA